MEPSEDIADASDWLGTPVQGLSSVESSLRCQVCKDFYKDPMLTSCCHTFCSICIHRSITSDGRCPLCRAPEERGKLRKNGAVSDVVQGFKEARPEILRLGHEVSQAEAKGKKTGQKRKASLDQDDLSTRKTRSQSRRTCSIKSSVSPWRESSDREGDIGSRANQQGKALVLRESRTRVLISSR